MTVRGTSIKRQRSGGAIGLELTGDLAQIFMNWYDRQMKRKMEERGVEILLYQRYVDDINMIYRVPRRDSEDATGLDEKWMKEIRNMGNQIHPCIQLEIDYPSRHEDRKMPILDLKV